MEKNEILLEVKKLIKRKEVLLEQINMELDSSSKVFNLDEWLKVQKDITVFNDDIFLINRCNFGDTKLYYHKNRGLYYEDNNGLLGIDHLSLKELEDCLQGLLEVL